MIIGDSIKQAVDSIRTNKLRAFLTLISISIGVFAIILSGTLVDSLNSTVTGQIEAMGENSFSIYKMPLFTGDWWKYKNRKSISYEQYQEFKERMSLTDMINAIGKIQGQIVQADNYETDPDVMLIGSDEQYFLMNNVEVEEGRPFTTSDIEARRNFAVIGNDIKVKLFPNSSPIGQKIRIDKQSYTVIGILEQKGSMFFMSLDNLVVIPISFYLQYVSYWWQESLVISVRAVDKASLVPTMDEAIGILRSLRNVQPWEDNDFEIETNESISEQFSSMTSFISIFGIIVSVFALIAAGVGIMNIMLVTVKERTREIGIRKAVGAKSRWVLYQFIIETITICQLGGIIGILLGIGAASVFSGLLEIELSITMYWISISIIVCTLLGLTFGAYPAWKAANLNPIDALRYE